MLFRSLYGQNISFLAACGAPPKMASKLYLPVCMIKQLFPLTCCLRRVNERSTWINKITWCLLACFNLNLGDRSTSYHKCGAFLSVFTVSYKTVSEVSRCLLPAAFPPHPLCNWRLARAPAPRGSLNFFAEAWRHFIVSARAFKPLFACINVAYK